MTHYWKSPRLREYDDEEFDHCACGNDDDPDYSQDLEKVTCDSCRVVMASFSLPAGAGADSSPAPVGAREAKASGAASMVDHPPHYTAAGPGSLECIDAIDALVKQMSSESAFYAAQVLKYIWRHEKKGKPLEDLKKAQWYLNRLITKMERKKSE